MAAARGRARAAARAPRRGQRDRAPGARRRRRDRALVRRRHRARGRSAAATRRPSARSRSSCGRGLIREGRFDYDFAHEQLRALVYEETSLARRRLLHGRAADALAGPGTPTVARHLRLAGRDAEAAEAYARAAEHARALFANAEALEHLRAALAARRSATRPRCTPRSATSRRCGATTPTRSPSYETAAAHCRARGCSAGIEHRIGQVHHRRGEWALATAHFEAALAADAGGRPRRPARASAPTSSLTAHDDGDPARAAELAEQARALAEQAGDPRALGQAHNLLGALATSGGDAGATRSTTSTAASRSPRPPATRAPASPRSTTSRSPTARAASSTARSS